MRTAHSRKSPYIALCPAAPVPADFKAPTLAWLNSGIPEAGCRVLKDGFKLGPTGSDEVKDTPLCVSGTSTAFGASNYEGEITVFRYFNLATGQFETTTAGTPGEVGDAVFQAHKVKGTTLWGAVRETSKAATEAWAPGDEVSVFEYVTDDWQFGEATGYIPIYVEQTGDTLKGAYVRPEAKILGEDETIPEFRGEFEIPAA